MLDPLVPNPSAKAVTTQPLAEPAGPALPETSDRATARARTLVVGRLQGLRSPEALEPFLDLSWCTAEDAPAALASRPIDLVLLDGSLPGAVLGPTLDALGTAHARPALL